MKHHATAVAYMGRGLLLLGESGCGKSDLAFRLLDRGWALIGDDQVHVTKEGKALTLAGDPRLHGTLEVRGLGLMPVSALAETAPLTLVARLDGAVERLPSPHPWSQDAVEIPSLALNAFEPSTPLKLEWAIRDPSLIGRDRLNA